MPVYGGQIVRELGDMTKVALLSDLPGAIKVIMKGLTNKKFMII
ncbi:hypothetical protein EPA3_051 [Pseudomonas phage vB_PaM_EPA3]|nr:hypothetical protein EPA3_051 [Pseudomonas phage vB_PaM_EPA3]